MAFKGWERAQPTLHQISSAQHRISPSHSLSVGLRQIHQKLRRGVHAQPGQFSASSGRLKVERSQSFPLLAGRYRIVGVLGQGAFSITIQAVDEWKSDRSLTKSELVGAGPAPLPDGVRGASIPLERLHTVAIKVMHRQYSAIGIQEVLRMQQAGCGEWNAAEWDKLARWFERQQGSPSRRKGQRRRQLEAEAGVGEASTSWSSTRMQQPRLPTAPSPMKPEASASTSSAPGSSEALKRPDRLSQGKGRNSSSKLGHSNGLAGLWRKQAPVAPVGATAPSPSHSPTKRPSLAGLSSSPQSATRKNFAAAMKSSSTGAPPAAGQEPPSRPRLGQGRSGGLLSLSRLRSAGLGRRGGSAQRTESEHPQYDARARSISYGAPSPRGAMAAGSKRHRPGPSGGQAVEQPSLGQQEKTQTLSSAAGRQTIDSSDEDDDAQETTPNDSASPGRKRRRTMPFSGTETEAIPSSASPPRGHKAPGLFEPPPASISSVKSRKEVLGEAAKQTEHSQGSPHVASADKQAPSTEPAVLQGITSDLGGLRPMRDSVDQALVKFDGSFSFFGHLCIVMELRGPSLLALYDMRPSPHLLGSGSRQKTSNTKTQSGSLVKPSGSAGAKESPGAAAASGAAPGYCCSWDAVARVAKRLFTALAHLERRGIMHADVKPDNILSGVASAKALLSKVHAAKDSADAARLEERAQRASDRMRGVLLQGVPASVGVRECDRALATLKSSALASAAATAGAARSEELLRSCRNEPTVVLADLGNSFALEAKAMYESDFQLQPAGYRAPEVVVGEAIGCYADVFSVGVVLLELCAGVAGVLLPSEDDIGVATKMATAGMSASRGSRKAIESNRQQRLERLALLVRMQRVLGRISVGLWADRGAEGGPKFLDEVLPCLGTDSAHSGSKPSQALSMRRLRALISRSRQARASGPAQGYSEGVDSVWAPPILVDLLSRCLDYDWRGRISAVEALCHPFLLDCAPCPVSEVGRVRLVPVHAGGGTGSRWTRAGSCAEDDGSKQRLKTARSGVAASGLAMPALPGRSTAIAADGASAVSIIATTGIDVSMLGRQSVRGGLSKTHSRDATGSTMQVPADRGSGTSSLDASTRMIDADENSAGPSLAISRTKGGHTSYRENALSCIGRRGPAVADSGLGIGSPDGTVKLRAQSGSLAGLVNTPRAKKAQLAGSSVSSAGGVSQQNGTRRGGSVVIKIDGESSDSSEEPGSQDEDQDVYEGGGSLGDVGAHDSGPEEEQAGGVIVASVTQRPSRGVAVLARRRMQALRRYDEQLAKAVGRPTA